MDKPMMKCGHTANATEAKTGKHVCAICIGASPDAEIVVQPPDLTGRTARCLYRGSCKDRVEKYHDTHYGSFDNNGHSFASSSMDLPFFEHRPNEPFDLYFCGCLGWD